VTMKLTQDNAREIRAAWTEFLPSIVEGNLPAKDFGLKAKEFRIELGEKYGVSQRTIQEVLLGRSFKEKDL
jgi:hypothetical protein